MVKALIRMGDMTTHGGKVLEGFSDYTIQNIPVAGVGHKTICPLCKGVFPIIQGYEGLTVNGVFVALEGGLTACGAKLIPSQYEEVVDEGGGGAQTTGAVAKFNSSSDQKSVIDNLFDSIIPSASAQEMEDPMEERMEEEREEENDPNSPINRDFREQLDRVYKFDPNYREIYPEGYVHTEKDVQRLRDYADQLEYQDRYNKMTPEEREGFNQRQEEVDKLLHPKSSLDDENSVPRQLLRHPKWSADTKILKQMKSRGWTEDDINEAIKGGPTGEGRDTRWTKEGKKLNDSTTVYGKPGNYVIINNRTGDVTQVSDKTDPEWKDDSRIEWTK